MTVQPEQARRGTALVAGSTLLLGVLCVVLALVLTACSGASSRRADRTSSATSSSPTPTASSSAAPTSSAPAPPASSTAAAPASTAPGDTGGLPTQAPVSIASPATFAAGITSTVIFLEPITATAALPGEISGPAVRLTVAVQNSSAAAVDLGNVTVDLQDAAGVSATSLSGNGAAPFTGSVAPGGSASGTYVFTLAQNDRTGVRLYVTCNASLPVVVFTGDLP